MTDAASLTFKVDSTDAATANTHLDGMVSRSRAAEGGFRDLHAASLLASAGFASFSNNLGMGSMQLNQLAGSLQQVVTNLQSARGALDGMASSFATFDRARMQAETLASALGTGAVAMEAFARQSSQFNMTSLETASALQRVTAAIDGQTAAGRALRTMMADYGVVLNGVTASNADKVLMDFAEKVRGFAATPANTQALQRVLGPLGVDALTTIQNPAYEPSVERAQRLRAQEQQRESAAAINGIEIDRKRIAGEQAQFDDLAGRYGPNQRSNVVTVDGRRTEFGRSNAGLMNAMDPTGGDASDAARDLQFNNLIKTPAGNNQVLKWLSDHPNSPFARGRRGAMGNLSDDASAGALGQLLQGKDRPTFDALDSEASHSYDAARQRSLTGTGSLNDTWLGRSVAYGLDVVGPRMRAPFVIPKMPVAPAVPYQPPSQSDLDKIPQGDAELLGGYGMDGMRSRFSATQQLRGLYTGGDTAAALNRVYGKVDGSTMLDNLRDRTQHSQDTALTPGADELDQIGMQRWLQSVPAGQRAAAQQMLSVARANGVSTSRWTSGAGMSFDSLRNGTATGAGAMTPGMRDAAGKIQTGTDSNFAQSSGEETQRQIDLQTKIRDVLDQGGAAVQTVTARWQAYYQVLAQGRGEDQAKTAGLAAQTEAMERNATAGRQVLANMDQQNKLDASLAARMDQVGPDPVAREWVAVAGGIDNDYITAKRLDPNLTADEYKSRRLGALGTTALNSAGDMLAQQHLATSQQRDTTSAAGLQGPAQRSLMNSLETERDFRKVMTDAVLAGDTAEIASIQRKIAEVNNLKGAYDALKQTATNLDLTRSFQTDADESNATIGMSPAQQRAYRAGRPVRDANRANPAMLGGPRLQGGGAGPGNPLLGGLSGSAATDAALIEQARQGQLGNPLLGGQGGGSDSRMGDAEQAAQNRRIGAEREQNDAASQNASFSSRTSRARTAATLSGTGALGADLAGAGVLGPEANAAEDAGRRLGGVLDGMNSKLADQKISLMQASAAATGLAEAYTRGAAAGEAFQRHLPADQEIAQLQALISQNPTQARAVDAQGQIRTLNANKAQGDVNTQREQGSQIQQGQARQNDQNAFLNSDINAGYFATDASLAAGRARVQTGITLRDNPGAINPMTGSAITADELNSIAAANEKTKELASSAAQVRQNFQQFGASAMQGFENAVVGGERLKTMMHGLSQDLERMLLKSFIEAPFEKAFSSAGNAATGAAASWFGSLFAAAPAAAAVAAQGAVLENPRFMAQGGLLTAPTRFMANGGPVVGGEIDNEAIMPLKRLPNGNLGVASTGGGGGHTIIVQSPITITGGGGGGKGGGMDPATMKALQQQMEKMHTQAVRAVLTNQRRDGGDLSTTGKAWS
jgi:hypothetical protein